MQSAKALRRRARTAHIVASCVCLALLLLAGRPAAQTSDAVGSITRMEGTATLVRNNQTRPVTLAMVVEINDKLITARGAHLTVTFGDNSSLVMDASTSIVINEGVLGAENSGISKVGLLGGRLRSIVNSGLRNVGYGFEVHTPNAIVGVRGTVFETAYITGTPCPGFPDCLRYTDVGVYKGRVEVSNPLNPKAAPVIAGEGFETTVPCEQPPATPSPLGMGDLTAPAYR